MRVDNYKAITHAVAILRRAQDTIQYTHGSGMAMNSAYNAAQYLLYGKIENRRGVAHLWANWPVDAQAFLNEPCICGLGDGHHRPDCPQSDSHVDHYQMEVA